MQHLQAGAGRALVVALTLSSAWSLTLPLGAADPVFVRGDTNSDGIVDISDPLYLLNYLFGGGPPPACRPIADANASGEADISDAIALLGFLFLGSPTISPLTPQEVDRCQNPVPELIRKGALQPIIHNVTGRVEHWSDRTIRIKNFFYDGSGEPMVVVWLYKSSAREYDGYAISSDLRRMTPYQGEDLQFLIPPTIQDTDFNYVAIWCTSFPLNYGYTRLFY